MTLKRHVTNRRLSLLLLNVNFLYSQHHVVLLNDLGNLGHWDQVRLRTTLPARLPLGQHDICLLCLQELQLRSAANYDKTQGKGWPSWIQSQNRFDSARLLISTPQKNSFYSRDLNHLMFFFIVIMILFQNGNKRTAYSTFQLNSCLMQKPVVEFSMSFRITVYSHRTIVDTLLSIYL